MDWRVYFHHSRLYPALNTVLVHVERSIRWLISQLVGPYDVEWRWSWRLRMKWVDFCQVVKAACVQRQSSSWSSRRTIPSYPWSNYGYRVICRESSWKQGECEILMRLLFLMLLLCSMYVLASFVRGRLELLQRTGSSSFILHWIWRDKLHTPSLFFENKIIKR